MPPNNHCSLMFLLRVWIFSCCVILDALMVIWRRWEKVEQEKAEPQVKSSCQIHLLPRPYLVFVCMNLELCQFCSMFTCKVILTIGAQITGMCTVGCQGSFVLRIFFCFPVQWNFTSTVGASATWPKTRPRVSSNHHEVGTRGEGKIFERLLQP